MRLTSGNNSEFTIAIAKFLFALSASSTIQKICLTPTMLLNENGSVHKVTKTRCIVV
jgi:hypothetical protein